jgi:pimeloyl-ACP methyl ester carboxylesterase
VSCGLSGSFAGGFPYPAADGSIKQNIASALAVAEDCAKIGDELQYFTTANTARDMDRIRIALGAAKISYWGQSYGTYLGAVYTSLFPQYTGRMVLEGSVDPGRVWQQQINLWNQGMNDRFPDAAKLAAASNATLGLGSTAAQVTSAFLALAARLDQKPAAIPGANLSLSGALLREMTYELLLHNTTLADLTKFWKAADDLAAGKPAAPDAAALQQGFADTSSPGVAGVPADNQATMTMALICGDASWSRNVASYAASTAAARAEYPLSDGMPGNIWPCAFWQKAPIEPPVKVTSNGPRDVLILQNRRDNATPWQGALGMAQALGSRAGFVGAGNGGHYVYGTGSACADQASVAFLTRGTLPAKPEYCSGPAS